MSFVHFLHQSHLGFLHSSMFLVFVLFDLWISLLLQITATFCDLNLSLA